MRADARRNRTRLVTAAREVFGEQGIGAPLEAIARRAGVSVGTLYNRFPTRDDLIDAVFANPVETGVRLAEEALELEPWEGVVHFLTGVCELQATDRGLADIVCRPIPHAPATEEIKARVFELLERIIGRAQRAGRLRDDVTSTDIAFVVWGNAATVNATRTLAPRAWRRHLALLLDGFRAEAAHTLPEPPPPPEVWRAPHDASAECTA